MTALLARAGSAPMVMRIAQAVTPVAGAAVVGVAAGYQAGQGRGANLLVLSAAAVVASAIIIRPDLAVMAWIAALLADGRQLTQFQFGRIYVTEIFLAVLLLALLPRLILDAKRRPGLQRAATTAAVLWVPGILGLAAQTQAINLASARNFAIVYYSVVAVAATIVLDPYRNMRRLLLAVTLGSTAAVFVAFSGISGFHDTTTSTGAPRLAHGSFSLPFGIAPLVLIAALNQRLIPLKTALLIPGYLVCLVLVNHRSAWLAFIVAAAMLALTRLRPAVVILGAIAACGLVLLFTSEHNDENSRLRQEIERAKTLTDAQDPNAQFRLTFWRKVTVASLKSPVFGSGFDAYPAEIVAPQSADDRLPAPHNSFVALLYRVGPLPFTIFLMLVISLFWRSFIVALREEDPRRQALVGALVAVAVYISVFAAFNVLLEAPYMAPLFWMAIGLLGAAIWSRRSTESS